MTLDSAMLRMALLNDLEGEVVQATRDSMSVDSLKSWSGFRSQRSNRP